MCCFHSPEFFTRIPKYSAYLLSSRPYSLCCCSLALVFRRIPPFAIPISINRDGSYTFDRTLNRSVNPPRSFHFLIHKRWCEYSLYSFSLLPVPKNLHLLSFSVPDCSGELKSFCQFLFRVAELSSPSPRIRDFLLSERSPLFSDPHDYRSDWHYCFLFPDDHTPEG